MYFTACSFNLSRQLFSEKPSVSSLNTTCPAPSDKQTKLVNIKEHLEVKKELIEMKTELKEE